MIGLAESVWLEFKGEPYQLGDDWGKLELAKDITAMTASNGVIVIGVRTKQDPSSQRDVADELRPVPAGTVDVRQLIGTINDWVFPRLDIDVAPYDVSGKQGQLWSIISFPKADDLPYIVKGELTPQGRPTRNFFGVFERTPAATNMPYSAEQVHSWIQRGRFRGLSFPIVEAAPLPDESGEERRSVASDRLIDDREALELPEGTIHYSIQAMPGATVRLDNFFEGADHSMAQAMSMIESIRPGGFRLPSFIQPERTSDGYRTKARGVSFSVTRKGIATLVVAQEILTWAMAKYTGGKTCVNAIALTEMTLEFWRFFQSQVMTRVGGRPSAIDWRASIEASGPSGGFLVYLPKRHRGNWPYDDYDLASTTRPVQVSWQSTTEATPGALAFVTLQEIYEQFGLDASLILASADGQVQEQQIRTF
jgi:hypothetical protein